MKAGLLELYVGAGAKLFIYLFAFFLYIIKQIENSFIFSYYSSFSQIILFIFREKWNTYLYKYGWSLVLCYNWCYLKKFMLYKIYYIPVVRLILFFLFYLSFIFYKAIKSFQYKNYLLNYFFFKCILNFLVHSVWVDYFVSYKYLLF